MLFLAKEKIKPQSKTMFDFFEQCLAVIDTMKEYENNTESKGFCTFFLFIFLIKLFVFEPLKYFKS